MNLLCFSSNDKKQDMSTQEDLLKRLEAVTVRLEAISGQKPALAPKPTNLGGPSPPRPFNKFPRGYRPVTDSTQDLRGSFGGGLRPSSSWSSFPQQLVSDQRSATLPHFPSSCVSPISPLSPVDNRTTNYWSTVDEPPRSRRPIRSESNSTVFDNHFSPRELSPLSVASEYCNNPSSQPVSMFGHRSVQSPVPATYQEPLPRSYDNVPRSYEHQTHTLPSQRETDFLRNLQRQKTEAQNMSSSWYAGDTSSRQMEYNAYPTQQQHQIQNPPSNHQPRRLAKTQSDLSFDSLNNTYFNNSPITPPSSNGGILHNSINNFTANSNGNQPHRLNGFFQNRVIEPNWMTDPPPPKSFREDYIIRNVPLKSSVNSSDFERFRLEPTFREPTRANSVVNETVPPNFRSYHRDGYQQQKQQQPSQPLPPPVQPVQPDPRYQKTYREPSPVRSPPIISYAHQHGPFSFPNPINQINYNSHEESRGAGGGSSGYQRGPAQGSTDQVYQNVPLSAAVAYREKDNSEANQSNRNSAIYSNEPIRLTNDRVLRIHPNQQEQDLYHQPEESHFSPPLQTQRARIQSPLRDFARLTSPIREVAPVQPIQPFTTAQDRIFSPVESKVYNRSGPTVINGFTSNRHTYNSHTDDYDARTRRDSSQPPVAVIEPNVNVHMPSDPIPYNKPHFGHGHPHGNGHNVHPVKPTSHYTNPNFSPSSNYDNDNDSDLDIEEMARRALPKYLRDNETGRHHNRNFYGDNLHGILIKNPSLHRSSSKKVVFIDQDKASAAASAAGSGEIPAHVRAYDDAVEEPLNNWAKLTDQIGGDLAAVKPKVLAIFDSARNYLWTAAGKAQPSDEEAQKMLAPVIGLLGEINNFKDSKRNKTTQWNHLNSISEALPALGWVVVKKTPAPHVKDYIEAAQFYINPILREFKDTNPLHVEWTKAWKSIFEEMQKFVRQVHTTGLVWNSAPGAVPDGASSAPSAAPVAAPKAPGGPGGPPPPPPPPPADFLASIAPPPVDTDKSNRDALFAQLNQGEGVTSRLKKVTADMQTHKNPNLRGTAAVPATGQQGGASPAKAAAAPVKKPPHKELENGKQWIVEYFVNDRNIVIDVADKKQTVYIYRCENSVIKVNGKANSITLDGCKKTSVVFDALVAQCETVNCQSVQIQTLGELPTLSIQKTDGCQVFLSKVAQACEIVTSKSSEMNISVQTTDDGEYSEFPVPEQFKTTFVNGKLVTVVSDIV
ncbi:hypothetical protein L3Y34_010444 [Caenorhabditis briggsae]|uniref:Adenylyl cyclase-associated protein n=1 Tax=Caenorhabditis briggsae TaxID=6238 RepID=A0AAE8ZJY9_CAEBR|nr:hypothetical protein L3Y34_010444 [Caenorhabditis briggsae]